MEIYGNTSDTHVTRVMKHRLCHVNKTIMPLMLRLLVVQHHKFSGAFTLWFAKKEAFTCCTVGFEVNVKSDAKTTCTKNKTKSLSKVKKKNWHRTAKDHRDKSGLAESLLTRIQFTLEDCDTPRIIASETENIKNENKSLASLSQRATFNFHLS